MTTLEELIKILGVLAALYPRFELKPTTVEAYHIVLKDLPLGLLKAATLEYATKDTPWFPSAGQLRSLAFSLIEHEEGQISAAEAWEEARYVMRTEYVVGIRSVSEDNFTDPAVYDAAKAIGFRDIKMMRETDIMSTRARFITAFETFVNRRRLSQRMLPEVKRTVQLLTNPDILQLKEENA